MNSLNDTSDLIKSSGIPSTPSMNPMEGSQAVQQNPNPVIFTKGVEIGKELSMSAAHSNIARLVTKNENGATGIANIANKEEGKFAEDITLSSALEKLKSAQDYNEDMKAVVLNSITKASSNEDKIAVLEKGLAFLETEKKLSECVQSGKMGLDEAKALLTESLDFGCSKDFSLEKLNEFNEFSTNEQDGSTIQQKASEVFGTEVSTVSSPVNNNQSQSQSTTQLPKDQKVAPEKTNHSSISKTIDTKVFNKSEFGEKFEKVVTTPQQQRAPEPKSAPLPIDNPQLEVVNQSAMELMSGEQIEGWEVPSSMEKENTPLDQKIKNLENYYKGKFTEEEFATLRDCLDWPREEAFPLIESGGFGDINAAKAFYDAYTEILNKGNSGNDSQSVNNETATFGINESAEHESKTIDNETKEKILTKAKCNSYTTQRSSSERRQMILDSLPESIDNATLDSILNDERCSRGVKTALLLSPNLTYDQKLKVVDSDKSNEIVAYCQKHKNVFPQVRSALTPTSKVIQGSMQFISKDSSTNLKSFVNAFFDQNGQFTTPDDIKDAKAFFSPSTFTTEERAKIVELLKEKKKQIGNASTSPKTMEELNNVNQEKQINRLKIDMMIAQFTEPWDEGLTQKFKIFDGLTKDVINILESNIDEAMNIDDSTGTITMKNFLKNPEEIAQKLSYIKDITLVFNQFQSPNESFQNSAIRNGNTMIVQQYPRLELLIKEACQPNNSPGHIDRVLNEAKTNLIDFEHGLKMVFITKKCSDFIEQHKNDKEYKGKTSDAIEKNFFTKTIEESKIELNGKLISEVGTLTKTNAKEVTQLAQALGYKETQ